MVGGKWLMITLALLSFSAPELLAAQAAAGDPAGVEAMAPQEMTPEELQEVATLHAELDVLWVEYRRRLGTTHEDDAKRDMQVEMQRNVAELLERHGMAEEEYQRRLFLISTDVERLELFERLLEEAAQRIAP